MDMLTAPHVPLWFQTLLSEKFYNACIFHEEERKNEKNMFCLDCRDSICPHCINPHASASHSLLQIRRYMYQDVIRLSNAEKLMDCAFVQSYTTNGAKVVFLKQRRRQAGQCKSTSNNCSTCERSVKHPYLYCSLSCKLRYLLTTEGSVFKYINKREHISLPEPGPDDGERSTPDTVLEQAAESGSSESGGAFAFAFAFACTATTQIVRKKRSSCPTLREPVTELTAASMNRRKGNRPQRAPFY